MGDHMNAITLFNGLTFLADVFFYLSFLQKKKQGLEGFQKGQWLTPSCWLLTEMG